MRVFLITAVLLLFVMGCGVKSLPLPPLKAGQKEDAEARRKAQKEAKEQQQSYKSSY